MPVIGVFTKIPALRRAANHVSQSGRAVKKCWHCPLLNKLSLLTRILAGSMLVIGIALIVMFVVLMHREAYLLESVLQSKLQEELNTLEIAVTDDLVIGDYATVQRELNTRVQNQHVAKIIFTPIRGNTVHVFGPTTAAQSPGWFVAMMNVPSMQGTQRLSLGGRTYGEINVQMNPVVLTNNAWGQFAFMLQLVLATLFLNVLEIYLILRSSLRPLETLIAAERQFADGDHAIRVAGPGSPEMRDLTTGFDSMAEKIEQQTIALKNSEQLWSFALEGGGDAVWDWNLVTNQVELSKAGNAMFGFAPEELWEDMALWVARVHPDDLPILSERWREFLRQGEEKFSCDYRVQCKDGHWIWIHTRGMVVQRDAAGRVMRMIGTHSDITERKQMEEQVRKLAFYDPLTALPNRRLLDDRLEQALLASKRSGYFGALLFLDLDNFKPLNDTHGHGVGDLLLLEVAKRLKNGVREMDTVARFGGDEFVVMLNELASDKTASLTQARQLAEKIQVALSASYRLTVKHTGQSDTTVEHRCTASIGVVVFSNHEASQADIMKRADAAMYRAKDAGRNQICFDEGGT